MGTRSTVHFYEASSKSPLLSVYQQFDGYPSVVGKALATFLTPITVVNGFGYNMKAGSHANGVGCLAAQFIAKGKVAIGGLYITTKNDRQEYDYHVRVDEAGNVSVKVQHGRKVIFNGTTKDFIVWCDEYKG